jgi:hypothetical protein
MGSNLYAVSGTPEPSGDGLFARSAENAVDLPEETARQVYIQMVENPVDE